MKLPSFLLISIALSTSTIATGDTNAIDTPYRLYNAKLTKTELPYVFDGRQIRMVKVLDIKDANTGANKAACANEWQGLEAYKQLCLNLVDHRIFAVEVMHYPISIFLQVPVSRIAKVSLGQHALVRMPEISSSGTIKSLPAFLGTLSENDLRRAL